MVTVLKCIGRVVLIWAVATATLYAGAILALLAGVEPRTTAGDVVLTVLILTALANAMAAAQLTAGNDS